MSIARRSRPARSFAQLAAPSEGQPFVNKSGEEIPPFALMHVTKQTLGIIEVGKPDTDLYEKGPPLLLANGPVAVADEDPGMAQDGWPAVVNYTDATPAIGNPYGPKHGVWTATKNYMGLRVSGLVDDTEKLAMFANFPVMQVHGRISAALAHDGTATFTIWIGPGGSEVTTSFTVTVRSRIIEAAFELPSSGSETNNLVAEWMHGVWYAGGSLLCPVAE